MKLVNKKWQRTLYHREQQKNYDRITLLLFNLSLLLLIVVCVLILIGYILGL